jgi:uracil-DNA glycosylase
MSNTETDLGAELERFVKEQASIFGEVISYVPAKAAIMEKIENKMESLPTVTLNLLDQKLTSHKSEAWSSATTLDELEKSIQDCKKCSLSSTRNKLVFGVGSPNAKLLVIGEAPGADEDEQGEPFVGRAGQLLTKMLQAIQFERKDIYIANILKSRPPNNRDPKPEEVEACEPYLWKQIALIQPRLILCMGRVAGTNLLKINESLGKMRGIVHDFSGIPVIVSYHPAALLRNPDWKHGAWEDLKKARKMYDEMTA